MIHVLTRAYVGLFNAEKSWKEEWNGEQNSVCMTEELKDHKKIKEIRITMDIF